MALFKNTMIYIYCLDDETARTMERTYNYPMFVKAFHTEWLPTYLHQAAISHLVEQAECSRYEPHEYDMNEEIKRSGRLCFFFKC